MAQVRIIQFRTERVVSTNRDGQPVEYINFYGLGEDGQMYEWFKNPGEWRPMVSAPRENSAF